MIPKNKARNFPPDFELVIVWGGVSSCGTTPLIVPLLPGPSDITRFFLWAPIMTGNHLDHVKTIPKVAQTTGTVDVFDPPSGISGPTLQRGSTCPNLHE